MKLTQYKEILHKCSKCGLCQEVCPMYQLKGDECLTARGILILLQGVLKKEIPLKEQTYKILNSCLRCGLCNKVCPSEILLEDIIFCVNQKYLHSTLRGFFIKLSQLPIFLKRKKILSEKCEKKCVYLGSNSKMATQILNKNNIEVLNRVEFSWGAEYLLYGNLKQFKCNFKKIVNEIVTLRPEFVVIDIPKDSFKQIINKYTNNKFNIKVQYIGDFDNSREIVCKYFNPAYAQQIVSSLKERVHQ